MKTRSILFSVLLLSIVLAASLAGCSGAATTTSAPPATTSLAQTSAPTPTQSATPTTTTPSPTPAPAVTINIAAASSLTDALKAIDALYTQTKPNVTLTPAFASSGTLQTQIENGAPVDIFISAAANQMDNLQKENLILTNTRKNLLNNKLVLIVPLESTLGLTNFSDLALDKVKKVAIGDPKSVPVGTYAAQAFEELGMTLQIGPKEVLGADARTVLTYVESGNVDAGIVYSTDALTSAKVKVVASGPADINAKVVYPVAVIKASKVPDAAKEYLDYLFGAQAKALFEQYGFTVVSN